jgi:hypothetical protein
MTKALVNAARQHVHALQICSAYSSRESENVGDSLIVARLRRFVIMYVLYLPSITPKSRAPLQTFAHGTALISTGRAAW